MGSISTPGTGGGTTAVLGVRFVRGLAGTGIGWGKVLWTACAGLVSVVTGAIMLGRGRRVSTGEKL